MIVAILSRWLVVFQGPVFVKLVTGIKYTTTVEVVLCKSSFALHSFRFLTKSAYPPIVWHTPLTCVKYTSYLYDMFFVRIAGSGVTGTLTNCVCDIWVHQFAMLLLNMLESKSAGESLSGWDVALARRPPPSSRESFAIGGYDLYLVCEKEEGELYFRSHGESVQTSGSEMPPTQKYHLNSSIPLNSSRNCMFKPHFSQMSLSLL